MTTAALIATAVFVGLLVSFAVCLLIGAFIRTGQQPADPERFDWLAPIDVTDDGADTPFPSDQAQRQAIALANCRPLAQAVVAEQRRLRSVQS